LAAARDAEGSRLPAISERILSPPVSFPVKPNLTWVEKERRPLIAQLTAIERALEEGL